MTISLPYLGLYVAAALFCMGFVIALIKRNAIFVLMGIELMLNAANLNLVIFSKNDPALQGQLFAVFSIVLAASEAAVALAILLNVYTYYKTSDLGKINRLKY